VSTNDTNYTGLRVTEAQNRQDLVLRGQRLEHFTVAWNGIEALVSIMAGFIAGSVALVGFGLDSVIEVVSGAALLWRLHHDLDPTRRERVEQTTVKIVGWLIALAAYIVWESGSTLIHHELPERSIAGIVVAAAAMVVMPLLARAKRRVAGALGSGAMQPILGRLISVHIFQKSYWPGWS